MLEVICADGHTIPFDDYIPDMPPDVAIEMKRHGGARSFELDEYDLPDWFDLDMACECYVYVRTHIVRNIPALLVWMEDRRDQKAPWHGFDEHYIGEFESDEEFGYSLVRIEHDTFEIPRWLDDLIDYSRVFDPAGYWKQDGYYFYHD